MNELGIGIKTVQSAIDQMHSWPTGVLVVAALVIIGVAIRVSHAVNNRIAPLLIVACGVALNIFIGEPGKVDPSQRYPEIVLGLFGMGQGVIALFIYGLVGKRIEKLFKQFEDNETTIIKKDEQ